LSIRERFGSDLIAAVYVEEPELFSVEKLGRLRQLHEALTALPFNERTDSLFTIPDLRRERGALSFGPVVGEIPIEPVALQELRERCLTHPMIKGDLLSTNGQSTLLILHLAPDRVDHAVPGSIAAEIEAVVESYRASFATIYQVGTPALQSYLVQTMRSDQQFMLPVCTLVVLALLVLLPARRLQLAGIRSRVVGSYAIGLWIFAMAVAIRPVAARFVIPILILAYLAPFVAAPDAVGRFLTRGRGGRGPDGPGADGRPVKDVTPPDQRDAS
jgi:predicted RND superfamily exporter protein